MAQEQRFSGSLFQGFEMLFLATPIWGDPKADLENRALNPLAAPEGFSLPRRRIRSRSLANTSTPRISRLDTGAVDVLVKPPFVKAGVVYGRSRRAGLENIEAIGRVRIARVGARHQVPGVSPSHVDGARHR